jgi:hypothetical protein
MSSIELIVLWATFLWNGILNFDNNKQTFKASKSSPSLNLSYQNSNPRLLTLIVYNVNSTKHQKR